MSSSSEEVVLMQSTICNTLAMLPAMLRFLGLVGNFACSISEERQMTSLKASTFGRTATNSNKALFVGGNPAAVRNRRQTRSNPRPNSGEFRHERQIAVKGLPEYASFEALGSTVRQLQVPQPRMRSSHG